MKKVTLLGLLAAIAFAACNNSNNPSGEATTSAVDSSKHTIADNTPIAEVSHSFTNVHAALAASLKNVTEHYLHLKNALVNDDGKEAANGSRAMGEALNKIDRSLFTAEQKKVYDNVEEELREHTGHIASNADKIDHQRMHFAMLSEDVYELVKAFGGGKELYHDYCPMANGNKGGMWLSETKEVKNPYFGGKMSECVEVKEVIR